jgi:hypothetical protein
MIKYASMPGSDRLVGNAEAQEKPSSREILQRRRLDAQRDCAPAINVINGRSYIQLARPRRDCRKQNQRIGAVRLALPECAKACLFN